jgi:hypothetical protein
LAKYKVGLVAAEQLCMEEIRNAHDICSENLKGRDHMEDLGVDGIVLEWNIGK